MAKVELNYNPYLMETEIKFNGHAPRINSLVEKYQNEKLQTWMSELPKIFHDEMNGYDFELEFTGTELEYEELKEAFRQSKVSEKDVQFFHKKGLDGRKRKLELVEALLNWMKENPNRKYGFEQFQKENEELLENTYSYIFVHGRVSEISVFDNINVEVESVEDVEELKNTDLKNTPILFWLDEEVLKSAQNNLKKLLNRADVKQEQLFFIIRSSLNESTIERTLRDLGVRNPQLVYSADDAKVKRYFEIYPITDYICQVIANLRKETNRLQEELESENKKSEEENKEVYEHIKILEKCIDKIKESKDKFDDRDNLEFPKELESIKERLQNKILNWKIRKTKITNEAEAKLVAEELERDINRFFIEFYNDVVYVINKDKEAFDREFERWFAIAEQENTICSEKNSLEIVEPEVRFEIVEELMKLKEENLVTPKDDFIGMIFKQNITEEKEPVLEITYYYQKWREHALAKVIPFAEANNEEKFGILLNYVDSLAGRYQKQLSELFESKTSEKDTVAALLSDEEQRLQEDNKWVAYLADHLKEIERG